MKNNNIPFTNVLVKPSGPDCNLNCTYCFYLNRSEYFGKHVHRMNDKTLEALIKNCIKSSGDSIHFIWQGGEPTLIGIDFYKKAVELQIKYGVGKNITNALQTNGTLLNNTWAQFLKKYNFLVGLSLDGPEHIHNRYRKYQNGEGSWKRVFESAGILLSHGVDVNAMICITDYSSDFPKEIYDFNNENGLHFMQFIPIVEQLSSEGNQLANYNVSPEKYGKFLCSVFDKWVKDFQGDSPITFVNPFEAILFNYVGMPAPDCTLSRKCGTYLVVEHNGDIFSCDFFVEPEWKLGNVKSNNLDVLLNSGIQDYFGKKKCKLNNVCIECEWVNYCQGGCPRNRWGIGVAEGNYLCKGYKKFYSHAHNKFKELAMNVIKNQQNNLSVYNTYFDFTENEKFKK